ncbi:MAG: GDP-mannose 4,6-dehydratase [Leptospiraceae bacterium]|nr:GDP-mannose 4,6-dehydratase [Leptospiraceae bacterium]MCB1302983.1 GDP-mannose 4,6-dehydratase [Leptospiraceae bacterium]
MQKASALITGAGGQDGFYLSDYLNSRGYVVYGLDRPDSLHRLENIEEQNRTSISLFEPAALEQLIKRINPGEIYHLAAHSFVNTTPSEERSILRNNLEATHNLLSVCREAAPNSRFCLACSAEIFGNADHSPQSEDSPIRPSNIYGASKAASHHLVGVYRQQGYFAVSAILFNHESARRGPQFVTQKIIQTAVAIKRGQASELKLGSMDAVRDWGYAPDYVKAMSLMLHTDRPADYVIATGQGRTVQEFAELVFKRLDLPLERYLVIEPSYMRRPEANPRIGDASRIRRELGWEPEHSFEYMVDEMLQKALKEG